MRDLWCAVMDNKQEFRLSIYAKRIVGVLLLSVGLHAAVIGFLGSQHRAYQVIERPLQVRLVAQDRPLVPFANSSHSPDIVDNNSVKIMPAAYSTPHKLLPIKFIPPPLHVETAVGARHQQPASVAAGAKVKSNVPLPILNISSISDMTYYSARDLDVLPQALQTIIPIYPRNAESSRQRGWVLLTVRIDNMGKVVSVRVKAATPPKLFDQSAQDAFAHAQFSAGQKDGIAVYSEVDIKVHYGE